MDIISNMRLDPEILKEPRGLLRVVQLVLSIFAFATVSSVRTHSDIKVFCVKNTSDFQQIQVLYSYPFRIKQTVINLPFCSDEKESRNMFHPNFSPSAEFFCFVGVVSFLICLVTIPGYLLLRPYFSKGTLMSKIDFIGSIVWSVVWFTASTAWADNMTKLILYMKPENLIDELGTEYCPEGRCQAAQAGDPSNLVVSVLFGYLNMGVVMASLWFLYKETDWHRDKDAKGENGVNQSDFDQPYADPGYNTTEYADNPSVPTTPTGSVQPSYNTNGQVDYYDTNPSTY